jgi:hypothetical protein
MNIKSNETLPFIQRESSCGSLYNFFNFQSPPPALTLYPLLLDSADRYRVPKISYFLTLAGE